MTMMKTGTERETVVEKSMRRWTDEWRGRGEKVRMRSFLLSVALLHTLRFQTFVFLKTFRFFLVKSLKHFCSRYAFYISYLIEHKI